MEEALAGLIGSANGPVSIRLTSPVPSAAPYVVTFVLSGPNAAAQATALLGFAPTSVAAALGAQGFSPVDATPTAGAPGNGNGFGTGAIAAVAVLAVLLVAAVAFIALQRRTVTAAREAVQVQSTRELSWRERAAPSAERGGDLYTPLNA